MIEEFRPGFGRGLTIAIGVMALAAVVIVAVTTGVVDALLVVPWALLFVLVVWAVFWHPRMVVSDAGIRLVNVTRTIDIPWPAVTDIETRYALAVRTPYGRYGAWAAPAPGAGSALRSSMRMRTPSGAAIELDRPEPDTSTMGNMPGTASGDAAAIVRRRWERLREDGFLDDPQLEFERLPMQWHWKIGAAVAGLLALSIATLFTS